MARTERGKAFEIYEPTISDEDVAKAMEAGRIALSLAGRPVVQTNGPIQFLAIKFALGDGSSEMILFDRMDAAAMQALIESADALQWEANTLKPGSTTH